MRRVQQCPPFGDLAAVTFLGQEEARILRSAAKFRDSLNACMKNPAYKSEKCICLRHCRGVYCSSQYYAVYLKNSIRVY